jgi:hypothetical protein
MKRGEEEKQGDESKFSFKTRDSYQSIKENREDAGVGEL